MPDILVAMAAGSAKAQAEALEPSERASMIDRHVGSQIRERRIMLGLTQHQLAQMIGVTYQQAHKYERGMNRVSAGRLYEIAQALGVPVASLFDGASDATMQHELSSRQRMCMELARNFTAIESERLQEALSQLARALAETVSARASEIAAQ